MSQTVTPYLEMSQAIMEAGGEALKKCYQCGTCSGTCPWTPITHFNIRKLVRYGQLGLDGIDKSEVSRIARELDEEVNLFLNRPLEGPYPYVWLDATYLKVRSDHRVVSKALVIALGVKMTGEREILGFAIGPCESEPFWQEFLKNLVARGLSGVELVISDAHEGLKKAIRKVLLEASWQRCTVHFMRNVLAHVPRAAQQMVAAYTDNIRSTRPGNG